MGTLSLVTMRSLVRSNLNELGTSMLSDAELNIIINDGYKDVCSRGLCYESKIAKTDIPASVKYIPLISNNIVRIHYVEYDKGATGCVGMSEILPQTTGRISINNYTPQYWFQWGEFLVVEPLPDVATYDLNIYASCYPAAVLTADADLPSSVPPEFHEVIAVFATSYASLKLRRWGDAALYYNMYIENIQMRKFEYIDKNVDYRVNMEMYGNVITEARGND